MRKKLGKKILQAYKFGYSDRCIITFRLEIVKNDFLPDHFKTVVGFFNVTCSGINSNQVFDRPTYFSFTSLSVKFKHIYIHFKILLSFSYIFQFYDIDISQPLSFKNILSLFYRVWQCSWRKSLDIFPNFYFAIIKQVFFRYL